MRANDESAGASCSLPRFRGRAGEGASSVTPLERYGRIILAAAVLGLFLAIVASMIAGSFLTPLLVVVVIAGAAGYLMMMRGQRG